MKSEIRIPNSEGSPKLEIRNDGAGPLFSRVFARWLRASGFGFPSDFGFRISNFTSAALSLALLASAASARADAQSQLQNFVTVRGDQLVEGTKPLRFIAFNIPKVLRNLEVASGR